MHKSQRVDYIVNKIKSEIQHQILSHFYYGVYPVVDFQHPAKREKENMVLYKEVFTHTENQ
ncbi:MAG: hypothetical protein COZ64_00500 [Candidatus Brennerbacteria bacterium CG_4_8_14_3_um_filter_43_14]|uniref:Uncharacterized protein n=1 Tax=Candidatus Brennerbacteria bacterium CG_4_8_14_3_um_filter_43_14 TaxID=1974521 RepID=A0A2H9N5X9_9BACT|nr:MAG: hypothetical protein COZ64_00500 [Candidatus Brennerbacteria bacterium CG_4_8_14_3_um_filter_43_14]